MALEVRGFQRGSGLSPLCACDLSLTNNPVALGLGPTLLTYFKLSDFLTDKFLSHIEV
ncbi:hypothetical protein ACRRTK_007103 [Alexandromys fortis]